MPSKPTASDILDAQAVAQERAYDWLGAYESYKKTLSLMGKQDFLALGDKHEKMGFAVYQAALQSETEDKFRRRCKSAIGNYEKAIEFYKMGNTQSEKAKWIRCEAMLAYLHFWIANEAVEKKKLVDECWNLTKECLSYFERLGSNLEYGRTFNQLSSSSYFSFTLEWNLNNYGITIREAVERGEKAIAMLLNIDNIELTKSYVRTTHFLFRSAEVLVPDVDEKLCIMLKTKEYIKKAIKISEKNALLELLSMPNPPFLDLEETRLYYEKALEFARETKDAFLIGTAIDVLAYANYWKSLSLADPVEKSETAEKAIQMIEEAKRYYSSLSYISPRAGAFWIGQARAEHYVETAIFESDLGKRRILLEKAVIEGNMAVEIARKAGYPEIVVDSLHVLSRSLSSLAQLEPDTETKIQRLQMALEHRNETIRLTELGQPSMYWNLGVMFNHLADLKSEIADSFNDIQKKRELLKEAVLNKERALQLCMKENIPLEKRGILSYTPMLGRYQYSFGEILNRSFALSRSVDSKKKAIQVFQNAAESFAKIGQTTRVAECRWRIAEGYHTLGEFSAANENFAAAAAFFKEASQRTPQFAALFQGYQQYMCAWSQIEKARQQHQRQEYGLAKEYYEKAAKIHKSLKQWNYLAPNYLAWSTLENAEDLSRKERNKEAIRSFQYAADLFMKSRNTLKDAVAKIDNSNEKQLAENLTRASEIRNEYCLGRIVLEEAKIFDKEGDHQLSSERFYNASKIFENIANALENETERKELGLIATLAGAWQKMTLAETEMSATLYEEAAQLFRLAKDLGSDEKTKMRTMGHSHFCKALESGTKFVDTRDMANWKKAMQELEAAGNYYAKASFDIASEFARATRLLFDAYVYIDKAKMETNPEEKTKLYIMTEKVLEASAEYFEKAEHPEKRAQTYSLLKEIEREKEFALSLVKVLHTPLIASTTSFPVPSATVERAVGSERFEHTNIQTNLKATEEAEIGRQFEVLLDIVNIGNTHGLLVRLDNLVPSGTKLSSLTPHYDIENCSVNLRGKKIDPQKLESIKVFLQPTRTGQIALKPCLVYVDDKGHFLASTPEPLNISIRSKSVFEFKTKEAESIFNYLVSSFTEDYMKRKLPLEKSGWRTLTEIIKNGKTPKSSVYGARGRRGRDLIELERRGIVESRTFQGERGRGGNILKARIPYDNETIKRYIDKQVMKT